MEIGQRIKAIRIKKRFTAKQLSELSKIPEKSIYKIEAGGVKDPRISSVAAIAKGLDCGIDELLNDQKGNDILHQAIEFIHEYDAENEIEKNYAIYLLEKYRSKEEYYQSMADQDLDPDVADDLMLLSKLEDKPHKTYDDYMHIKQIKSTLNITVVNKEES